MAYVLLWIEHLAAGLLLVATLAACISRMKRTWLRVVLSLLVAVPLVGYAALLWSLGDLRSRHMIIVECFYPFVFLTACYAIGAAGILLVGLRRGGDTALATDWPRGKLALMAFVVVGLHMMTWWNMELAVKQRMATLKAEAGALRLSLAPAHIRDRDNAAVIYEQTYRALGNDSWPKALRENWHDWYTWRHPQKHNDPDLKPFLDEQRATLILLRQGAQKPGCHFGRDYGRPSIFMEMPELMKLADAARLLSLNSAYHAQQGDMETAIEDINAIFAIAEHMSTDPVLYSTLMSAAIHQIAIETLQDVISIDKVLNSGTLTIEQLESINLESSLSFRRTYRRGLQGELATGLSVFPMLTRDAEPLQLVAGLVDTEADSPTTYRWPVAVYRMFMVNSDVASYRQMINSLRELAVKPYHKARTDFENFRQKFESEPHGLLSGLLMPEFSGFAKKMAISDARHRAARLALAAERFRFGEGKGDLPENLEALAPDYIPTLSLDPFDGKPMKYRRINEVHAIIYSIGPDDKDDNGTPLNEADKDNKIGDVTFELKR